MTVTPSPDHPAKGASPTPRSRERVLKLDYERLEALEALISVLTELVAEAHSLTTSALRFDRAAVAQATSSLSEMADDPSLDLARMTEIYCALRRSVADGQPGRRSTTVESMPPPVHPPELIPPPQRDIRWPS